jgi:hypothetical protein
MASRIKSPLLCQLSYRPKIAKLFGKLRAARPAVKGRVSELCAVPPATDSDDDVMAALGGVVSGRAP